MAFGDHKFGDGMGIQITLVTENRPNYLLWAKAMKDLRVYIYFFLSETKKSILIEETIQEKEGIQEKEKKPKEG